MQTVILARDPFTPTSWTRHDVEDVRDFLVEEFGDRFPPTARIYHGHVSQTTDVTPVDEADIERLGTLDKPIHVIVYPGDPITILIITVVAVIAIAAAIYLLTPPPTAPGGKNDTASPNNSLSNRQNKARPAGRIPDIYGKVKSTPDLLTFPYKIFVDNIEVEIAFMCVGRGYYYIQDVRDGETLVSEIDGTSVAIYDPYTSPNAGSPSLLIGDPITEPLLNVRQVSGVNGQTLPPPNLGTFTWTNSGVGAAASPYRLTKADGGDYNDFRDIASPGDEIQLTNFAPGGTDLNGTYIVDSQNPTNNLIYLKDPHLVNSNWTGTLIGTDSSFTLTNHTVSQNEWIGPFTIDMPELTTIILNFVALNGLYTMDTSGDQILMEVALEVEATPINADGSPRGAAEFFTTSMIGSSVVKTTVGKTMYCNVASPGRYSVRVHRTTNHDYGFAGTIVEEVKIREIYGAAPITNLDFGNVTTVYAKSLGTTAALSVKDRKINMTATRKLQLRISGSTFDTAWTPTQSADEIIAAICRDPYMGNRPDAEINYDQIYETIDEVKTYFGTAEAGEFNHTFDTSNLSFEEIIATIADAVFCTAYRRGNVIELFFEKETEDSSLIFNHRNKIPRTETRTTTFGNQGSYDGVWFNYVDSEDGSQKTLYIPDDRSSINPRKVDSVGITSDLQAHFKAWRLWNKIRYQNVAVQFDATQEGDICIVNERILVADNTRDDTIDGEIIGQATLEIELSRDVLVSAGMVIHLQHYDGSVEAIPITQGSAANKVILSYAPILPLAIEDTNFARPTFVIVKPNPSREIACLVTEKSSRDSSSVNMIVANYDSRYYANDLDHINNLI